MSLAFLVFIGDYKEKVDFFEKKRKRRRGEVCCHPIKLSP